MIRFNLFGIPVSVHWFFWLLAAFLGGALYVETPQDLARTVVFMAAAFVSIVVHELGHALAGMKMGARQVQIVLHGLGGLAQFGEARLTRGQSVLLSAAGPAASVALGLLFLGFARTGLAASGGGVSDWSESLFAYFVLTMVVINFFWSAVNLCPVLPLDGGQIVRHLLGPRRLKLTCLISFAALAVLAVFLWLATRSLFNMALMVLLGSYTWRTYQAAG